MPDEIAAATLRHRPKSLIGLERRNNFVIIPGIFGFCRGLHLGEIDRMCQSSVLTQHSAVRVEVVDGVAFMRAITLSESLLRSASSASK